MPSRGRHDHRTEQPLWVVRRPLQRLHATHRPPDDAEQRAHAQMVDQQGLRTNHVGNGDDRKGQAPGLASRRIDGRWTGRAHAAAKHIRRNDEVSRWVHRQARANQTRPPAWLARNRMDACGILIAGQGVTHQYGIGAIRVQDAVGLIGDLQPFEPRARIQAQRRASRQTIDPAADGIGGAFFARRVGVRVHKATRTVPWPRCQHTRFR